jgi:hypothetical protein
MLLLWATSLYAQAPASKPETQAPAGLETDWEIAPVIQELGAHASRMLPLLDRIDARSWVGKGASETYAEQLQSSKDQARAVASAAKTLAQRPERLSAALELLFRINGLNAMLTSLEEGIRKYQRPADAQALVSLAAEGGAARERFERYIVNLAAVREQELAVMDREAQRCRGTVTALPAKSGKKK